MTPENGFCKCSASPFLVDQRNLLQTQLDGETDRASLGAARANQAEQKANELRLRCENTGRFCKCLKESVPQQAEVKKTIRHFFCRGLLALFSLYFNIVPYLW
jgi:hypothetical protein